MRRRPPEVESAEPQIPERLRSPILEDWVTVGEIAAVRAELAGGRLNGKPMEDDVQEVSWSLLMRARSRARTARNQWAAEAGVDARTLSSGKYGNAWPDYRDESVFLAEIRRAIADRRG